MKTFIAAHTALEPVPLVPEIELYRAGPAEAFWQTCAAFENDENAAFPFWAYPWAGGQGLARYLLDNPEVVRGKRVLDFACGGGLVAIAAAKAGAVKVVACDVAPLAHVALAMNTAHNGVDVELGAIGVDKPVRGVQVVLAGDVCYEHTMAHRVMKFLRLCAEAGTTVLIGDPGRGYAPDRDPANVMTSLARYEVPVLSEIEETPTRAVTIWRVGEIASAGEAPCPAP